MYNHLELYHYCQQSFVIYSTRSIPSQQSIVLSSGAFLRHLLICIEILLTWN